MSAGEGRGRTIALVAGAIVLAVIFGGVLMTLDGGESDPAPGGDRLARDPSAIDLLEPPPLDGEDDGASGRGWIQITDDAGRLAQQYRCDFLDPSPSGFDPGWLRMTRPQLEIHQDDGSVVVLTGDEALAFAPASAIESGTLSGDVTIRIYGDAAARRDSDPTAGLELELRTERAKLNGVLGEVTCPGPILAESAEGVFAGSDVRMLLGDGEHAIASLNIRTVQHVRFVSGAGRRVARDDGGRARGSDRSRARVVAEATPPPATPDDRARSRSHSNSNSGDRGTSRLVSQSSTADPAVEAPPRWYRLVLHDEVRIRQGASGTGIEGTADLLHVIFGDRSDPGGGERSAARPTPRRSAVTRSPRRVAGGAALAPRGLLLAAALGAAGASDRTTDAAGWLVLAPAPSPDDTWLTCTGSLTMRPMIDETARPVRDDGIRVELLARDGRRVRVVDHAAGVTAVADRTGYELPQGRITLDGTVDRPVTIDGAEFGLVVPGIELVRADAAGRLRGGGTLRFREAAAGPAPAGGAGAGDDDRGSDDLDIRWDDDVRLTFAPGSGGDDGAATWDLSLDALETARFAGDVQMRGQRTQAIADAASAGIAPADDAPQDGELGADTVEVTFEPVPGGPPALRRLVGLGDVGVRSGARRLWADRIDARFSGAMDEAAAPAEAATATLAIDAIDARGAVTLRLDEGRWARGDALQYLGGSDTAVLSGDAVDVIDGPDRLDQARLIRLVDGGREAVVEGSGRLRRDPGAWTTPDAADGDWTSESPLRTRPGFAPAPPVAGEAATTPELLVTWSDGLAVGAPGPDGLRRIVVTGDATTVTGELSLRGADELVAFVRDPAADGGAARPGDPAGALERIEARGSLEAIALSDGSQLSCETLAVDLAPGDDGGPPSPRRLEANGAVRLVSDDQRLWTDRLTVDFETAPDSARPARPQSAPATGDGGAFGARDIRRFVAEPRVELRLADGRRILGQRLEGSGLDESAVVTGDLLLATEDTLLTEATRVEVAEGGRTARVVGPGRFVGYRVPLGLAALDAAAAGGPTDAAALRQAAGARFDDIELDATWTTDATWVAWEADASSAERPDAAGGRLVLRGDVDAEAEPDAREVDRVEAMELVLEFGEAAASTSGGTGDGPAAAGRRTLQRMIARGDASLQSRAWLRDDRVDDPRVLAIQADDIDWDQRTGVALVDGPGRLIVRDLRPPDPGSRPGTASGAGTASPDFGARGTTEFTWTGSLRLEPATGDDTRITMTGDVGVAHRGLDGAIATIAGRQLIAVLARVADSAGAAAGAAADGEDPSTLALGGPVELASITATDRVYVSTPQRDVSCERFAYDARSGIARLASAPGRPAVSILEAGTSTPVTISGEATWEMATDRIRVVGASGGADR